MNHPNEITVLTTLNNIGAIRPEKAISFSNLLASLRVREDVLRSIVEKLVNQNYIEAVDKNGEKYYYLTSKGILIALSTYS
ncbi:MAG: hypothetical protein DRJ32_04960 [Thermoprotei archaeon]|nr:MAG: hypothetical protein DRJ32_04960 [Thermoprotei archaeon]HDD64208.1 hypothetical protein [Thermoprotei archaeon]